MKKIFKKNQFVVTALAVLIAVAGYLNYADKLAKNDTKEVNNTYDAVYKDDDLLNSDDDILSMDADSMQVETADQKEDSTGENQDSQETVEPGAAVLTSGNNLSSLTIEARLNREQTRSKNKETLLEVINNESLAAEQKKEAVDAMVKLTETTELENNIETVLEAKGYSDVIVTLSENQADVIVNAAQVSDSDRAQIEDVITRKTDIKLKNIVITPMNTAQD